jgi:hypothetical protein
MKKIQKLQVTLNEVTRMQQLAGIISLNENGISEIAAKIKGVPLFHKDFKSALNAAVGYAEKRGYDVNKSEVSSKGEVAVRNLRTGKYNEIYINLKKNGKIQSKSLVVGTVTTKPTPLNPNSQVKLNFDIRVVKDLENDRYRTDDVSTD